MRFILISDVPEDAIAYMPQPEYDYQLKAPIVDLEAFQICQICQAGGCSAEIQVNDDGVAVVSFEGR